MNEIIAQLRTIIPGLWSYRWTALIVAIPLGIILGFAVAKVPNQYEATARVHVDTQTMLQPLMRGLTVQPDLNQQIKMMARTLLSRPNMERVIKQADLDLRFVDPVKQDEFIKQLQQTINFGSAGRSNLYSIRYRSRTPDDALRVVRSLLDVFVEESIGDKRRDGDQARQFIDEQIESYERRLVQAENALKEFKLENLGRMPDSQQDYITKSTAARQELEAALAALRQAASARNALQREAELESPLPGTSSENLFATAPAPTTDTDVRLTAARQQLDGLMIRYTESHPDVENLKFVIGELEKRKAAELEAFARQPKGSAPQISPLSQTGSSAYNAIRASLAESEAEVASLQARVASARERLAAIRTDAQSATEVETALAQLNRDYEVNKKSYEELLSRRESVEIAGSLNRTTNLAEFRIVDPPRADPKAVSPDRPLLMLAALGASIAAGLGIALLRTFMKPVFYDPDSVAEVTGHQTLGVITTVAGPGAKFARFASTLSFSGLTLAYIGLFLLATWYLSRYGVPVGISDFKLPAHFNQLTDQL
ncbi:MAG: XrtA system polysaccharide chain length determinant [Burkholderiaceae bacterium]